MSVIAPRRKLAFVHTPKTGGVAICNALDLRIHGHRTLAEINARMCVNYFGFSFVRNPWDRLVSSYHYFKAGGRGYPGDRRVRRFLKRVATFDEFARQLPDLLDSLHSMVPHFLPQTHWGDPRLEFTGRFENFDEDFDKVCKKLGVPNQLKKENTSEHMHYSEYYSEETAELVGQLYQDDALTYNYKFGVSL